MIIEAEAICLTFGQRKVLDRVDLWARPGEVLGLIGPNGAGKSSLLSVLAGLRRPHAGTLLYDSVAAQHVSRAIRSRRLAYLAQAAMVDWDLTVDQVVALGRLPHHRPFRGADRRDDARSIAAAMAATDIAALAGQPVQRLSGGERMRVLLARALAVEADMLLADEPVAGLDPHHQLRVMSLLAQIAAQGTGVIVVLHDLTLAARFCDRVLLLHRGKVAAAGAPGLVLTSTIIRDAYSIQPLIGDHEDQRFVVPWRLCPGPIEKSDPARRRGST